MLKVSRDQITSKSDSMSVRITVYHLNEYNKFFEKKLMPIEVF